jgi:hypothetical protein
MERYSTGLRNFLLGGGSMMGCFSGGRLGLYGGTQPTDADATEGTTVLCWITDASGTFTAETQGTATITLSGADGQVDNVTIAGLEVLGAVVAYDTDLATTAAAVAAQINSWRGNSPLNVEASAASAVITLTAAPGTGTQLNGETVVCTVSGGTLASQINGGSSITFGGAGATAGVASVNGLSFDAPSAASMAQKTGQTWSGVVSTGGTVTWARLYAPMAVTGASTTAIRMDMSVAQAGADITITQTLLAQNAPQTMQNFSIDMDAS